MKEKTPERIINDYVIACIILVRTDGEKYKKRTVS